jgi:hypothetical protein
MSNMLDDVTIRYHPEPGDVFFCRFPTPGEHEYAPPEMVKVRRVVALSPRYRRDVLLSHNWLRVGRCLNPAGLSRVAIFGLFRYREYVF